MAEFAPAELGVVLATSTHAAERLVADALDLRHRLPRLWARIVAGEVKPWIGRKTADTTRHLSEATVAVVDRRIAKYAHSLSWGRIEAIITATWLQCDPDAAAEADEQATGSLGVWVKDHQPSEHGTREIFIRAEAPDALRFNATIGGMATGLGVLGDTRPINVRRAAAVGILAHPQAALDLFTDIAQATDHTDDMTGPAELADEPDEPAQTSAPKRRRVDTRPDVTLYVHLTDEALGTGSGVARVEQVGPVTLDRVRTWLGHANVVVKPVIDLNDQIPVDAYEIPDRIRDAVHLRTPADCFPYATSTRRTGDLDHTIPYLSPDNGGPPGQTSVDNLGPLTRNHHRIKTHGRWQVAQPFNGIFVWRSPHGRYHLVDHTGTHPALPAPPARQPIQAA